jgi:hypothetical protein
MEGLCFNCLSPSHRVAACNSPSKCRCRRRSGHTSSSCPRFRFTSTRHHPHSLPCPATSHLPHQPTLPSSSLHAPTPRMAHFDLSGLLEFDVCNLPFSEEIKDRVEFFESHLIIIWIGRNRPRTDPSHVAEAFVYRFGLDHSSIQVSRHHPADFLVSILDRDVFEEVASRDSLNHGGRQFHLWCWSPRDQATHAGMRYYVRISLKGLPLHLWSESFTAAIIGRSCSLHYAEERSRRGESTEVFELLAWSANHVVIPLRVWLTVLDPQTETIGAEKWNGLRCHSPRSLY